MVIKKQNSQNNNKGKQNSSSPPQKVKTQPGIYKSLKQVVPRGLGVIGNLIEPGLGNLADAVSTKAMDLFGKITGFGDYTVEANSLVAHPGSVEPPPSKFGDGSIRIKGTDFVGFVKVKAISGGNFQKIARYWISPSNVHLFPKLSIKAQMYQKAIMHGLIIRLVSTCSESITTPNGQMSIPTMLACTKYNTKEADFENESQFLNSFFCSDARVNKDFMHPVECDRSTQPTNVIMLWPQRPLVGAVRDSQFENLGVLELAQVGGSQTSEFVAYKMYADYDCELIQPLVRHSASLSDHYKLTAIGNGVNFSNITPTSSSTSYSSWQPLYSITGNVITFPDDVYGEFEIEYNGYYSAPTAVVGGAWTLGGNCTAVSLYNNDTTAAVWTFGTTTSIAISKIAVKVTGGGTVTIGDMTSTNWQRADLFIDSIEVEN